MSLSDSLPGSRPDGTPASTPQTMPASTPQRPAPEHGSRPERSGRGDGAGRAGADITQAIRLGWALAEVRGRCWSRGQRPATERLPLQPDFPLPLRPQRSLRESRRQAVEALCWLAECFGVAAASPDAAGAPGVPYASRLAAAMKEFDTDDDGPDLGQHAVMWAQVAELMHDWDAVIQDQLAARDDLLACGYLLGRGLAEIYWALPDDARPEADTGPGTPGTWRFLLSPGRRHELSRMLGRVAPALHPLTPVAISGSLEAWGCVAADPRWCGRPDAVTTLYGQVRIWYQLLALGQDPTTLFRPGTLLHGKLALIRIFRAFWVQLVLGALSVAAVAAFALLMGTETGGAMLKSVLAVAGAIGLSASTLAAKAKSASQSLVARLRQSAYSDMVAVEVTTVPPHPADDRASDQQRSAARRTVEQAVTARTVAPPIALAGRGRLP